MRRGTILLLPVLCLLLTACSGKANPTKQPAKETEQAEILLTVDGREVPIWRYLCWLRYACEQVQTKYAAAGNPVDWDMTVEGETLADYVKQQALADTVLYATVENWAEQYDCKVEETEAFSAEMVLLTGLDEAQKRELWAVGEAYAALYRLYCTEGSVLAPSQEEREAFAEEQGTMTLDRIFVSAGSDREAAKQRAAELFSRLNAAGTSAEVFASLAAEGSDVQGPRLERECGWEESLLEAARSLEVGQCSGILESEEGFSILLRLETDPEVLQEEAFDAMLQKAAEAAVITVRPEYQKLDPSEFCVDGQGETLYNRG